MARRTSLRTARTLVPVIAATIVLGAQDLAAQVPSSAVQIAGALQAAPIIDRAGAKVLGFQADGSLTTLREGSNELVCLADDPNREGWGTACYHESLDPYMARGRELRGEGVTDAGELAQRRWDEADAGTLSMPEDPATLYVLTGDGFDADSETRGFWIEYRGERQGGRLGPRITTAQGSDALPFLRTGDDVVGLAPSEFGRFLELDLEQLMSRDLLKLHFQRVVFHSGTTPNPGLALQDFSTRYCPLREDNIEAALHASGSIPFVLTGEKDIAGAPRGHYWDGGIIDYHFDLDQHRGDGLILYPHFSASVIPGWFDKFLPWRKAAIGEFDHLVLICPSEEFIADLPHGKIPDRSDFSRMPHEERVGYWQQCVERSKALAEEFAELVQSEDPLRNATIFD